MADVGRLGGPAARAIQALIDKRPGSLIYEDGLRAALAAVQSAAESPEEIRARVARQLDEPFVDHRAFDASAPGRVPPRECIRAARDALNKMYSTEGPVEKLWMFMAEALDWQRRALEQIAELSPPVPPLARSDDTPSRGRSEDSDASI